MFDLHLHSTASDGDAGPAEVVQEASRRGLSGISLTDHNGLWGVDEAKMRAQELGLKYIEGIEVTARYKGVDVHVLGYSQNFNRAVVEAELTATRAGYAERIQKMVERCQAAGYTAVTWENIQRRREGTASPCYVSFDVAREIAVQYAMDLERARKLTVNGGVCHVPYGDWAMSPDAAVALIHRAGGVASLAHPGTIERESSREILLEILAEAGAAGLEAIEVSHPFHDEAYQTWLRELAGARGLRLTGGSDWHGPDHLFANDAAFGKIGIEELELPFPLA